MGSMSNPPIDWVPILDTRLSPAVDFRDVDLTELYSGKIARAILVAVDGEIVVLMGSGKTRTIPAGTLTPDVWHDLQFTRILTRQSSRRGVTTANGIWAAID